MSSFIASGQQHALVRTWQEEHVLRGEALVYPVFVVEGVRVPAAPRMPALFAHARCTAHTCLVRKPDALCWAGRQTRAHWRHAWAVPLER